MNKMYLKCEMRMKQFILMRRNKSETPERQSIEVVEWDERQ